MRKLLVFIIFAISFGSPALGASLEEAVNQAVKHFANSGKISQNKQIVISGIKNYHSQKKDQLSKQLETELYFAFEKQFPEVKLIDESESISGVSSKNTLFIKGSYKQKGGTASLQLKAIQGMLTGEIIDQVSVKFETQLRKKTLVVVLDIESKVLNSSQTKAFSDLFRSFVEKKGNLVLASSADVNKMNPDAIQKQTGCTRDECATIIGEQLGVDRVISSSLFQTSNNRFMLSAKMMDIQDGSILRTATERYEGTIDRIDSALGILAEKLMGRKSTGQIGFITPTTTNLGAGKIELLTPTVSGNRKSLIAGLLITSKPSGAEVFLGEAKAGKTPYQSMSLKSGQTIRITLKAEDYHDKKLEVKLSGGFNKLRNIKLIPKFGKLTVKSNPAGASILIAGEKVGITPYIDDHLSSGVYLISIRKKLYLPLENDRIVIKDGGDLKKDYILTPNFGKVKISTNPENVEIQVVDEKKIIVLNDTSPANLKLEPGDYQIKLSKKGYASMEFRAVVARNKKQTISAQTATLRKLEGYVMVSSKPYAEGARVFVNGIDKGETPIQLTLAEGKHKIEVLGNKKRGEKEIDLKDGETIALKLDLNKNVADVVVDDTTSLMWQIDKSVKMEWQDAVDHCSNLSLAGYSDWRLPDKDELKTAYKIKSKLRNFIASVYWSSTYNEDSSNLAWLVSFYNGKVNSSSKTYSGYVLCVRGGKISKSDNSEINGTVVVDQETNLMWQKGENNKMDWQTAVNYCQSLSLAGHSDWRLPDKDELYKAYKIKSKFPDVASFYWSSTAYEYRYGHAWSIFFDDGYVHYYNMTSTFYVRCVRGKQAKSFDNSALSDKTVVDQSTGLIWQKNEPGVKSWQDGMDYCNNLSLAGHSDWRLPNKDELYKAYKIKTKFPNIILYYWSSTTSANHSNSAWLVNFDDGVVDDYRKTYSGCVRCVRGGQ